MKMYLKGSEGVDWIQQDWEQWWAPLHNGNETSGFIRSKEFHDI
jgi:hypothetical protein